MYCSECGTQLNGDKCPNCGFVNQDTTKIDTSEIPIVGEPLNVPPKVNTVVPYKTGEEVSVLRWIGRLLVVYIPFVGSLVNLIMMIIRACSDRFDKTSKNWAVASIILILVKAVICIFVSIFVYAIVIEVLNDPEIQRAINQAIIGY